MIQVQFYLKTGACALCAAAACRLKITVHNVYKMLSMHALDFYCCCSKCVCVWTDGCMVHYSMDMWVLRVDVCIAIWVKSGALCIYLCVCVCVRACQGSFRSGKTGKVRENQKTFSSH